MTRIDLLEQLKAFTEDAIKDLLMPTSIQKGDTEEGMRTAEVHLMRLPDSKAAKKKAPYIIHQLITARDIEEPGEPTTAEAVIRSIFCVYSKDEEEGAMILLNLMERVRIALMYQVVIAGRYELDKGVGVEYIVYPDDTAPYYAGEMATTWTLPAIERGDPIWLR